MKSSKQENVARIERFASLWERLNDLYLSREDFEEITPEKENAFLSVQGSIMIELGSVEELEEGRFALVDEVTSVIGEAVSLHQLKHQSEFQVRRRKERGQRVAELITNVKNFVVERDTASRKREHELEDKLSRPFYDPEKGRFWALLARIIGSPNRFFSSLRLAGEATKANSYLFSLLGLLMLACFVVLTAFNANTARTIGYNLTLELGILSSGDSFVAKVAVWAFVVFGLVVASLGTVIIAAILSHFFALLAHAGFKIGGGKGSMVATHKVVIFGLTPLLFLVLVPVFGYVFQNTSLATTAVIVLAGVVLIYVLVLHVIGFKKVHKGPVVGGILGWLFTAVLFSILILGGLYAWHASVDGLPPLSKKYVYVTAKETQLSPADRWIPKGTILTYVEEKGNSYTVEFAGEKGDVKKADVKLRQESALSLPRFLVESSLMRGEALIDRLTRGVK
jgi:hypothetical protein